MTAEIDIRRPREHIATCPECGHQQTLPPDWQAVFRESMGLPEALAWDGVLRCKGYPRGHTAAEMIVVEVIRPFIVASRDEHGGVIVHLSDDCDNELAACTGQPAYVFTDTLQPYTPLRQCQACAHLAMRGGYQDS
jgi:hypothetical protein